MGIQIKKGEGEVKFYTYKQGGPEKGLAMLKGGGGGRSTTTFGLGLRSGLKL